MGETKLFSHLSSLENYETLQAVWQSMTEDLKGIQKDNLNIDIFVT